MIKPVSGRGRGRPLQLTEEQQAEIVSAYATQRGSINGLAKQYDKSRDTIRRCLQRAGVYSKV